MHAVSLYTHFALGPLGCHRKKESGTGIERGNRCMKCNSALTSAAFLGGWRAAPELTCEIRSHIATGTPYPPRWAGVAQPIPPPASA